MSLADRWHGRLRRALTRAAARQNSGADQEHRRFSRQAKAARFGKASVACMRLFFEDEGFDGQLRRSVGKADSGMANAGESLTIATQITPGDRDSWYRSGELSGYLFAPPGPAVPPPTILHVGGYDDTAEELYASAAPVLERGYAFAAVDGPGQGAMLYEQRVQMRPDWEHVVPGLWLDANKP